MGTCNLFFTFYGNSSKQNNLESFTTSTFSKNNYPKSDSDCI